MGESVLLKEYRGQGLYRTFFDAREKEARHQGCTMATFCAVERPENHPLRPEHYIPLDEVWKHFGYIKNSHLKTQYSWQDVDLQEESLKPMVFWVKGL
jgi:GNAT superfamily N-acetyltransferase